jgi:hypothetical protein
MAFGCPQEIRGLGNMKVENEKGEAQSLVDWESYNNGYRQAVCDFVRPPEPPSFPIWPIAASCLLMLALIQLFEGIRQ